MLGPRLIALATATGQLTASQVRLVGATLDDLDCKRARRNALATAVALLNDNRMLSRTQTARRLSAALLRFQRYGRIVANGYRNVELETACAVLLATPGPIGWRRLYDEIRRLG